MANTFILGGSPLGLVGTLSRPTADKMSTFNGGNRNINVDAYNTGSKQETNITNEGGQTMLLPVSLFTGDNITAFWGNLNILGKDRSEADHTGLKQSYNGFDRDQLHSDEIYDTSILNIIEKLSSSTRASLRPQDFAYLKQLGVYPNNRLVIARRFTEPQTDNIMAEGGDRPLSVLISWLKEDEDFISFNFSETWKETDSTDFTEILNNLANDYTISEKGSMKLGDSAAGGLNITNLPGVSQLQQRKILEAFGILDTESTQDSNRLPQGNPNLIVQSKHRSTVKEGSAGSGLKGKFSIKMVVEYEQKFISGIDPTVAWMDILSNALSFGTSNSDIYGLSKKFAEKIDLYTSSGGINRLIEDMQKAVKVIVENVKKEAEEFKNKITGEGESGDSTKKQESDDGKTDEEKAKELADKAAEKASKILDGIIKDIESNLGKYKIQIMSIIHALSGLPSTPWHVTIGNPLRPVFSSGDMYIAQDVNIKMGSKLSFNDLPSNITITLTLESSRDLGLQEILAKFNTGHLRVVNRRKDFISLLVNEKDSSYIYKIDSSSAATASGTSSATSELNSTGPTVEASASNGPIMGPPYIQFETTKVVNSDVKTAPKNTREPAIPDSNSGVNLLDGFP